MRPRHRFFAQATRWRRHWAAKTGRSFCSADSGKTYTAADLSAWDKGKQPGEYLIRIAQSREGIEALTPSEMLDLVKVNRAASMRVTIRNPGAKPLHALTISPDAPPKRLEVLQREGGAAIIRTPETRIYQIVLISPDPKALAAVGERSTSR